MKLKFPETLWNSLKKTINFPINCINLTNHSSRNNMFLNRKQIFDDIKIVKQPFAYPARLIGTLDDWDPEDERTNLQEIFRSTWKNVLRISLFLKSWSNAKVSPMWFTYPNGTSHDGVELFKLVVTISDASWVSTMWILSKTVHPEGLPRCIIVLEIHPNYLGQKPKSNE